MKCSEFDTDASEQHFAPIFRAQGTCNPCPKSTSISLTANPEAKLLLPLLTCDMNTNNPCCHWFEHAKSRVQPKTFSTPRSVNFSRMDFSKGYNFFLQRTVPEGLQTTTPTVWSFIHCTDHTTCYTAENSSSIPGMDKRLFPFPKRPDQAWSSRPSVKRSEPEANHPPPPSFEINSKWSNTSIHPYAFTTWCSVQQRSNFIFLPCNVYCSDCIPLLNTDDNCEMDYTNQKKMYFIMSQDTFQQR